MTLESLGYAFVFLVGPVASNLLIGAVLAYYVLRITHGPLRLVHRWPPPLAIVGIVAYISVVVGLMRDCHIYWPVLIIQYLFGLTVSLQFLGDDGAITLPKIQGLLIAVCIWERLIPRARP